MDLRDFLNRAKILRSIDQDEFTDAGLNGLATTEVWTLFRENPIGCLIEASDDVAALIWGIVQKRAAPQTARDEPPPIPAHPLDGKLEPELKESTDERAPLYSLAISAKRIADVLERGAQFDVDGQFAAITNLAWEAGRSFKQGAGG